MESNKMISTQYITWENDRTFEIFVFDVKHLC